MKHFTKPSLLCLLALSVGVQTSHSFQSPHRSCLGGNSRVVIGRREQHASASKSITPTTKLEMNAASTTLIGSLRGGALLGGAAASTAVVTKALQSGPFGILGLTAIAWSVVTPLTLYRQAYAFTVGYALFFVATAVALQNTFAVLLAGAAGAGLAQSLLGAMVFYGLRLAVHLLLREATVKSKRDVIKNMDKTPRLKRIPFALSIGLFHSFLATPALYLCRTITGSGLLSETATTIAKAGVGMAWFGAIIEAWTDTHKFWTKRGKDDAMDFHGPSSWWYGVSRHPNYLGEIIFWLGVLLSGLPSMLSPSIVSIGSAIAAGCSVLGTFGIVQVMLGATKRLEGKQDEKYGGQLPFEEWKAKTSKLAPTKIGVSNAVGLVLPVSITVGLALVVSKVVIKCLAAV